ncbi:glycerol-3-phosphate 1-O-acyltransferase PlsB [Rhodocyclus gracilis]|uniref:Glycerol-3-phosphate acyltransferase n=1 Tax=Rhodocyclus tenuis TaxID=1066 RepID=A0A6L5JXW5_RHOTE|nr:glycerol-3-phosphate 1-O-acyltransferase PlsB [Rhodocyclus gracilis]MQY51881.1 glycerol-3-phosphate 1-O-acyltransferase PlsB [Rhodocyclus gracilis]
MLRFLDLSASIVMRRMLRLWVRADVFPDDPASLGIDPEKPVCYVLQDGRLANLLTLFDESRRAGLPLAESALTVGAVRAPRSVIFLTRRQRLTASARERYEHSPLLVRLVEQACAGGPVDVQLVPVTILWGRSPKHQDSILGALFAETWRVPGILGQILAVLVHGRNVLVRFNTPVSLTGVFSENAPMPDAPRALRKLSRVLRVHFRRQREMAIGPDLSHRNTQVDALLAAPTVRAAISAEAATRKQSPAAAEARARRFALEIASDYSYGAVRALELFLTWLWNRLYDGVEVHHIDRLASIAPGQSVIYTPCHRSHVDYLLLSFILYRNGLTPPHIAAGANLNLPLVGPLLRRGGAFFMRRTFKGEPLYAAVFHEYLHLIITRGFPIEYFIEGGRSRSGRLLAPKAGILGMTVRSFVREHQRPLIFVPVYIGYEKVVEGSTYLRELEGRPKQRESLWGVLRTARRLKREFGTVHVNFGEPLPLAAFLDGIRPGWTAEPAPPASETPPAEDWPRAATLAAAGELAQRINEAAVINPINLIALTLLATPKHAADEQALLRQIAHCQALLAEVPYSASSITCAQSPAEIVATAQRMGYVEQVAHPLGDLLRVVEQQAPQLAYFRNNVLHLIALPALMACLLSHNRRLGETHLREALAAIYSLMRSELYLRWSADELPAVVDAYVAVLLARGLLERTPTGDLVAPETNRAEFADLRRLGENIRPTLERHFLILALLERAGSGCLTRRGLEEDCHLLAQRLTLLYEFNTAEFSERSLFTAVLGHLLETGLLHEGEDGLLHFEPHMTTPLRWAELVLPADVRQAVRRMAGEGVVAPLAP